MFTGFASENTPAVQVWDFFRTFANIAAIRSVSLADDCAPIQIFRTGATTTLIRVYLPTCPPEGKRLTITNSFFGTLSQSINIFSPDVSGTGDSASLFTLGPGGTLELIYTKQAITFGTSAGLAQSGWVSLNFASSTTSNYGALAIGNSARASGSQSVAVGDSATASGSNAVAIGGVSSSASSLYAVAIGGINATASGTYSVALGGGYGATRSIAGNCVFSANATPIAAALGATQTATLALGVETTNATPTTLRSTATAAGTTNQVILPNNSAYAFQGIVIANVTSGGNTSAWKFEGAIKRGANAASTTLVAAVTPTVIAQDAGASAWALAVTADTTNGGLKVEVTGAAATTIRWVCKVETTEVTF
jgi:hypothetical protein